MKLTNFCEFVIYGYRITNIFYNLLHLLMLKLFIDNIITLKGVGRKISRGAQRKKDR